jgi:hypothetical protein
MGRPLKIQKTSTGSGNGGAAVSVDIGFPNFGSLTAPVVNTGDTLSATEYLGVVGGAAPTDTPTTTNPRIDVIVNIAAPSGTGIGVATGYIIRQKGSHKYLVGDATGVNDGSFVVGQAYQISTVGTTTNAGGSSTGAGFGGCGGGCGRGRGRGGRRRWRQDLPRGGRGPVQLRAREEAQGARQGDGARAQQGSHRGCPQGEGCCCQAQAQGARSCCSRGLPWLPCAPRLQAQPPLQASCRQLWLL